MNCMEIALEGRVGQAPTLRTSQAGKPWCSFTVGVGDDDERTWVGVAVFGSRAEELVGLEKGTRIYVEGRVKLETWTDKEGRERTGLKVAATLVQPMGQIGHRRPKAPRNRTDGGSAKVSSGSVYAPLDAAGSGAVQREQVFEHSEIPF